MKDELKRQAGEDRRKQRKLEILKKAKQSDRCPIRFLLSYVLLQFTSILWSTYNVSPFTI